MSLPYYPITPRDPLIKMLKAKAIRTATLTVTASDSKDKYSTDYACDGVADQEEINTAIGELP